MDGNTNMTETSTPLLGPNDPSAFEKINSDGTAHLVLICDHAVRAVPTALGGMGMQASDMERHIA